MGRAGHETSIFTVVGYFNGGDGNEDSLSYGLATESVGGQFKPIPTDQGVTPAAPITSAGTISTGLIFAKRTKDEARRELGVNVWNGIQTKYIRFDFESILGRKYRNTMFIMSWTNQDADRVKKDSVTKEILRQIDYARTEPMSLVQAGMRIDEIIRARPDLVLKLGDIRHAANESARRLIKEGKHAEALSYYESVKTAFKYCGMADFDRPNFSGE